MSRPPRGGPRLGRRRRRRGRVPSVPARACAASASRAASGRRRGCCRRPHRGRLALANFGWRERLTIAGVAVGRALGEPPHFAPPPAGRVCAPSPTHHRRRGLRPAGGADGPRAGPHRVDGPSRVRRDIPRPRNRFARRSVGCRAAGGSHLRHRPRPLLRSHRRRDRGSGDRRLAQRHDHHRRRRQDNPRPSTRPGPGTAGAAVTGTVAMSGSRCRTAPAWPSRSTCPSAARSRAFSRRFLIARTTTPPTAPNTPGFATNSTTRWHVWSPRHRQQHGRATDEYPYQEQRDLAEVIAWLAAKDSERSQRRHLRHVVQRVELLAQAAGAAPIKGRHRHLCRDDWYTDDVHLRWFVTVARARRLLPLHDTDRRAAPVPALWGRDGATMGGADQRAPAVALPWLEHTRRDEYWEHGSIRPKYSDIGCPVLLVAGWADGYRNNTFRTVEALRAAGRHVELLAGPWPHAATRRACRARGSIWSRRWSRGGIAGCVAATRR